MTLARLPALRARPAILVVALAWAFVSFGCGPILVEPPPEARVHNDKGANALKEGNYDVAIKEFELALKLGPMYVQAMAHLGLACHKRGFSDRAIKELHNA